MDGRAGSAPWLATGRGSAVGFSVTARARSTALAAFSSVGLASSTGATALSLGGALGAFSVIGRFDSGTLSISGRASRPTAGPMAGRRTPGGCGAPGGFGGLRRPEIISGSSSIAMVLAAGGGGLREGIAPPNPGVALGRPPAVPPEWLSSSWLRSLLRLNSDAAERDGLLGRPAIGLAGAATGASDGKNVGPGVGGVDTGVPARALFEGGTDAGAGAGSSMSTSTSATVGGGGSSGPPGSAVGFTLGTCTGRTGSSRMIASKRSDASRGKSSSAPKACGRRATGVAGNPADGGTFGP
jgi:hypothetical protein